ncbi:hypothetical protein EC991_009980 [Linnemannia zychae]|nr:hypothetical protein EC991_009980 [Linnemannia zychae]
MHKTVLLLLALSSVAYSASTYAWAKIENNAGSKYHLFQIPATQRKCYCVKNTQTAVIMSGGSNTRAFSSSDCTGSFHEVESIIYNAQWVNSISLGKAGISSSGPGSCPKYY